MTTRFSHSQLAAPYPTSARAGAPAGCPAHPAGNFSDPELAEAVAHLRATYRRMASHFRRVEYLSSQIRHHPGPGVAPAPASQRRIL